METIYSRDSLSCYIWAARDIELHYTYIILDERRHWFIFVLKSKKTYPKQYRVDEYTIKNTKFHSLNRHLEKHPFSKYIHALACIHAYTHDVKYICCGQLYLSMIIYLVSYAEMYSAR